MLYLDGKVFQERNRRVRKPADIKQKFKKTKPIVVDGERIYLSLEELQYDRDSHQVQLEKLSPRDCHWPINNPEPGGKFLFCGCPAKEGKRYCEHHYQRSMAKKIIEKNEEGT